MVSSEELEQIIQRIEEGQKTDKDIEVLRQGLSDYDHRVLTQLSKYNVNIVEGKDIRIGDTIYKQLGDEAISHLVCMIQFGKSIEPKIKEKQAYYQK